MAQRVLVVDDHPPTRDLVRSAIEALGVQVSTAENGAEALLSVSREIPDLVILDVMMPVMDGFQALQVLRQSDETKEIPVIMLTAKSGDEDVAHGWRWRVTSYLTKPFSVDALVALVRRVLENSQVEVVAEEADHK